MDEFFMGIDPGLSGAWAVIDEAGGYVSAGDMHNEDGRVLTRHVWAEMVMAVNINSVKVEKDKKPANPAAARVSRGLTHPTGPQSVA
jgi:hypothetical protein